MGSDRRPDLQPRRPDLAHTAHHPQRRAGERGQADRYGATVLARRKPQPQLPLLAAHRRVPRARQRGACRTRRRPHRCGTAPPRLRAKRKRRTGGLPATAARGDRLRPAAQRPSARGTRPHRARRLRGAEPRAADRAAHAVGRARKPAACAGLERRLAAALRYRGGHPCRRQRHRPASARRGARGGAGTAAELGDTGQLRGASAPFA